jgi:hypothetical protein
VTQPPDPFSTLAVGMSQMHETYAEMRKAGFSERQALELMKGIIATGMAVGREPCPECGHKPSG